MTTQQDLLEAYKKAIKLKFEAEKTKEYSSFLMSPSRAKLRQLCVERLKDNTNSDDLKSYSLFFGFEFDLSLNSQNKLKSQTDKFRPIETFLKEETDLTDIEGINIAAILVDFKQRPFRKFLNSNPIEIELKKAKPIVIGPIKNIKKNIVFGILGIVSIASVGYTAKQFISPEPQCMQWQKNHFEVIECNTKNQQGLFKANEIIPFEEELFELKRIHVTDTTSFFKNGKAILWYCKVNGKPEFFNTHGLHPETNKALRPVSEYIVEKYVK